MPGVATHAPTLAELEARRRDCVACPLAASRTKVVFGVGNPSAELMLVGEGPGHDEDLQGEPFVGRSGKLLDQLLAEELGIDRSGCYIANVVKCRPPGNRNPLPDEMAACRHFLDGQIGAIAPRVIVTLGNVAAQAMLGTVERGDPPARPLLPARPAEPAPGGRADVPSLVRAAGAEAS